MKRVLIAVVLLVAGARASRADEPRELTVFAASSLKDALEDIGHAFEARAPGVKVRLSLAGSQELRTQIEHGARADVFASADEKQLEPLVKAGLVVAPRVFARNQLVVVVPRGNPAGLSSFADLPRARRLVIGAPEVPVGSYTVQVLDKANATLGKDFKERVLARVVSRELNVRQVLAKVTLGEADAAVVYRTDAAVAGDRVEVIPIPPEINVTAAYPVGVLKNAPQADAARAFVDFLLSGEGQNRLAAAGFSVGTTGK